ESSDTESRHSAADSNMSWAAICPAVNTNMVRNATVHRLEATMSISTAPRYVDEQIERANASGLQPVLFIHGLWLLPSSWDRWMTVFEQAGYATVNPGWPDDPETVEEANAHPEVFAHKTVGQVADHYSEISGRLERRPAVIGHSFAGLLAQILAGRGLSAASVAIDPAPFRAVLSPSYSALRS